MGQTAILLFAETQKLNTPLIPRVPKMISEWKDTPYQWRFVEIVPDENESGKMIVRFKSFTPTHVIFDSGGPQPPKPTGPEATHYSFIVDKCVIKSSTSVQVEVDGATHLIKADHFSLIRDFLRVRGWHD